MATSPLVASCQQDPQGACLHGHEVPFHPERGDSHPSYFSGRGLPLCGLLPGPLPRAEPPRSPRPGPPDWALEAPGFGLPGPPGLWLFEDM